MKVTKRNLAKTVTLAVVMATTFSVASAATLESTDVASTIVGGDYTLADTNVTITSSATNTIISGANITIGEGQTLTVTSTADGIDYFGVLDKVNVNAEGQNTGKLVINQNDKHGNAIGYVAGTQGFYVNEFEANADSGSAVYAQSGDNYTIDAKKITLNANFANDTASAAGVYSTGLVTLQNFDELNIGLKNNSDKQGEGGYGIVADGNGKVIVKGAEGSSVNVATEGRAAIAALNSGDITITADSLDVSASKLEGGEEPRKNSVIGANVQKDDNGNLRGTGGTINITVKDTLNITADDSAKRAIGASDGGSISIGGTADMVINGAVQAESAPGVDSSITLKGNNIAVTATGTAVTEGAVQNTDITATGKVTIDAKGELSGLSAGNNPHSTASIKADEISITSEKGFGVYANDYGWHTVGTRDHIVMEANTITIDSKKDGLCVMNGAVAKVTGFDTLDITSNEQGINSEFGNITIDGGETHITAEDEGIRSLLGGNLTFKGDLLDINAGLESIKLTGHSAMTVETDVTQLDGDITLENDKAYGKPELNINFKGEESFLTGKVSTDSGATTNLTFSDGAIWTNTGDSNVTSLTTNGGIIDLGDDTVLEIDTLAGSDLTLKTNSAYNTGLFAYNDSTTKVSIDAGSGVMNEYEEGIFDNLNEIIDEVVDGAIVTDITIAEGNVLGEITADVKDGQVMNVVTKENKANAGMIDMTALSLVTWRDGFDDLNSRLGDLRNNREESGIWARFSRGESSYNSVKNQANMYQVGYDKQAGDWTVGLAYSYTDGTSSFDKGTGENTHNVVSLYGTKMNDNGTYLDLVAKYGNLDYEYDVRGGVGGADYDVDAYAFSAEVGKRITSSNGAWVEPQFQLTYGTVDSATFMANGIKVHQNSVDSFVARAGIMAGKPFAKGDIYLRASYLYDFDGEVNGTFSNQHVSTDISRDLGGGWWEVGVGMRTNLSDATHLYLDFEKAFAGEVDTDWKWNAGVRYSF